jgi:hypothetical protein
VVVAAARVLQQVLGVLVVVGVLIMLAVVAVQELLDLAKPALVVHHHLVVVRKVGPALVLEMRHKCMALVAAAAHRNLKPLVLAVLVREA